MVTLYAKGARVEREFKSLLEKMGYLVTRVAGSGKSKSSFYDLHSINGRGESTLWEIKSTSGDTRYLRDHEVKRIRKLSEIAKKYKLQAYVVIKFKGIGRGKYKRFLVLTPEFAITDRKIEREDKGLMVIPNRRKLRDRFGVKKRS